MPELDGFEVSRNSSPRARRLGHLPIVALTARSRSEDRDRCLAAGMDEFLTKPFRADDLWAVIDRLMGWRGPAISTEGRRVKSRVTLDAATILATCGSDETLLAKMCQTFQAYVPEQLTALQQALEAEDTRRVRRSRPQNAWHAGHLCRPARGRRDKVGRAAAQGRLNECRTLGEELGEMAADLVEKTASLYLKRLQDFKR